VASNHEWVVPASFEERRFFILDVGDQYIQDDEYFGAIVKQMKHGGYEALLYMLQHYDLRGKNLKKFPQTEALLENKLLTMKPIEQFWHQRLINGELIEDEKKWNSWILRERLHKAYCEYVDYLGLHRKANETILGSGLNKLVPGLRKTDRIVDKRRIQVWEFPDLPTCREAFDKALNHVFDWEGKGCDENHAPPTP